MAKNNNDKRTKIIEAALKLIGEKGFHNSPTSMIAQNAGVGTGTIYRYFENKDVLIKEIHKDVREELHEFVFADDDESLPVRERFIKLLTRITDFFIHNPHKYRFMEQFYNSPFGLDEKRGCREDDPFGKFFDNSKKRNMIKNMDNTILFALSFGPVIFLLKDHFSTFIHLNGQMIREVIEASWDALKL